MARRLCLLLGLLASAGSLVLASPLWADDATERYFRGLRERKLFGLAESYALHRLGRDKLTPLARADLASELAQTLSEHALYAPENEQQELWRRARAAVTDVLEHDPKNPRRWVLEAQKAIIPAVEGEWCRWQSELIPYDVTYADRAKAALSEALDKLRRLAATLNSELPASAPRNAGKGDASNVAAAGLSVAEMRGLLLNVRYRTAEVLLGLVQLLPSGSPDRAAHLIEAEKLVSGSAGSDDHEYQPWRSRILFATCLRLQGDAGRLLKYLDDLRRQKPPADVLDRLTAEEARLYLAQKKLSQVDRLLTDRAKEPAPLSGELRFLRVQMLGDAWRSAQPGSPDAERLQRDLEKQVEVAEREVGGYWSYRCKLVQQHVQDLAEYGPELAPLVRQGELAYANGKTAEAIAAYGKATTAAFRGKRDDLAFTFGYTRASILLQNNAWADAAAGFQELARHFPKNAQAAQAQLLAAFALGKLYAEKQSKPNRVAYTTALEVLRTQYAGDPSAAEATWMLAQLEEHRQQYTAALGLYRDVPLAHARGPASQAAIARCYEKILDRLRTLGEPRETWETEAIQNLSGILAQSDVQPGDAAAQRMYAEVALHLARILLDREPPAFAEADRLLAGVFNRLQRAPVENPPAGAASDPLKAQAARLRIVSLAGQGKVPEARELLNQLSATDPAELLRILEGLAPLLAGDQKKSNRDLGELQLQAALKLTEHRDRLQPAEQRRLDVCLAQAYANTGQMRRALEVYEQLTKAAPRDKALLTSYAELLMQAGDKPHLRTAQECWRKLESLVPAGSDAWLEARYRACECLFIQEEKAECLKLVKVTRLLYPNPKSEKLKEKFAALQKRCEAGLSQPAP